MNTAHPVKHAIIDMNTIQILDENIDLEKFDDSKLPSDVHLVRYTFEGEEHYDAVRAYTMVDIFDVYYDKIKGKGQIHSIKSGYGKIRPNLYGKIYAEE
jgi:hypothetical protein